MAGDQITVEQRVEEWTIEGGERLEVVNPVVEIIEVGIQGPAGPGGSGDGSSFEHTQDSAAVQWTVNHNLGYKPVVGVYTLGGSEMIADVVHTSVNQTVISFAQATAGVARFV